MILLEKYGEKEPSGKGCRSCMYIRTAVGLDKNKRFKPIKIYVCDIHNEDIDELDDLTKDRCEYFTQKRSY